MLGKAGNTRAGKIFPRVAERNCQKPSAKATLPTAPLGKEATFCFIFWFPHWQTHTHTHIYIYMTISHAAIDNTYISHPHVNTHHMCPQVHTHHKSIETSPQIHRVSQIQWNKFRTWSTKSKGLQWVLVWRERWDGRLEDLLTTWSMLIRTRQERLHKGDKIASVRHD
jgi:hypothetical protein